MQRVKCCSEVVGRNSEKKRENRRKAVNTLRKAVLTKIKSTGHFCLPLVGVHKKTRFETSFSGLEQAF